MNTTTKGNPMSTFKSQCHRVGSATLPAFSGVRVMMLPIIIGDLASLPEFVAGYRGLFHEVSRHSKFPDEVGYLTIDEKIVPAGGTHRRGGLHVDGIFGRSAGSWGGGGWGGGWGGVGTGMLTVASRVGCRAWNQEFDGWPGGDGECDALADQLDPAAEVVFEAGGIYWVDGLCVHESIPMAQATERAFVRLSNPSTAPWFEGYTENPLGIKPTGPILDRRKYL
jgi:hypothetical protein